MNYSFADEVPLQKALRALEMLIVRWFAKLESLIKVLIYKEYQIRHMYSIRVHESIATPLFGSIILDFSCTSFSIPLKFIF